MNINVLNLMLSELTAQQKAGWGVNGLVIGLGSVFIILIILIFVINLLKLSSATNGRKSKKTNEIADSPKSLPERGKEDENEIIAAIAAAINCMAQREGKHFAIKSYRRIGSRTKRSY